MNIDNVDEKIIFCPNGHMYICIVDAIGNITYPEQCVEDNCEADIKIPFRCEACGKKHWPLDDEICPNTSTDICIAVKKKNLMKQFNRKQMDTTGSLIAIALSFIGVMIAIVWGALKKISLFTTEVTPGSTIIILLGIISLSCLGALGILRQKKINRELHIFIEKHDPEMQNEVLI